MNLITGGLGSAIFSLPWSVAGSSVLSSLAIIALVLLLNGWTISIMVRAAERHNTFDLGGVIAVVPKIGKHLQVATNVFVWASMFLCLVSYVIVIHDSAEVFVSGMVLDNRMLLVTLASVCIFPLCFLSQRLLEKTSSLAIAVNVYLFVLVGVLYVQAASGKRLPAGCCLFGSTVRGNISIISVMFQAVIVQMCVLPMYKELEDRSPAKFDRIVAISFTALFFIFSVFSVLGYLLIGPGVSNNIMANLPKDVGSYIAQVGIMLVVACVYPIMVYPMIAPIVDSGREAIFGLTLKTFVVAAKVVIVVAAMLTAAATKSLGQVNVFNGAMSAGIFVALVPSVTGLLLLDTGRAERIGLVLLLVIGLTVSAAGLWFNDNYVENLTCMLSVHGS